MRFEFAAPTRIIFGPDSIREIAPLRQSLGSSALVVTGRDPCRARNLIASLSAADIRHTTFSVTGEPTIHLVRDGTGRARELRCDCVIAIGGGSVMDAGKAIAALATNPGEPLDYLEVVGRGQALERAPLPFVAVPTTAGTGSEVTRNAVLGSPEHQVKVSLRSPLMAPRLAVIDPNLALDLPAALTASTGLDALTQLIEPFVSSRANPVTDALCRDGLGLVARSLRRACSHPTDLQARADMALASLYSGLALANAGLGAAHGLAAPIGGRFPAPHGAVCAALLPHVMTANLEALRQRQPHADALARYAEIAVRLTGRPGATAEAGVQWVSELCRSLEIPPLRQYGIRDSDCAGLCEKAAVTSSMKGNPLPLTSSELQHLVRQAI